MLGGAALHHVGFAALHHVGFAALHHVNLATLTIRLELLLGTFLGRSLVVRFVALVLVARFFCNIAITTGVVFLVNLTTGGLLVTCSHFSVPLRCRRRKSDTRGVAIRDRASNFDRRVSCGSGIVRRAHDSVVVKDSNATGRGSRSNNRSQR